MTNAQAAELVQGLIAAYPTGEKVSRETAAVYTADLVGFDYDEARDAIAYVRRASEFFPTIAAITDAILTRRMAHLPEWPVALLQARRYAESLTRWRHAEAAAQDALDTRAYREWTENGMPHLLEKPAKPADEVMEAMEAVGGLTGLLEDDNPGTTRAHFRDAYHAILAKRKETMLLEPGGRPALSARAELPAAT